MSAAAAEKSKRLSICSLATELRILVFGYYVQSYIKDWRRSETYFEYNHRRFRYSSFVVSSLIVALKRHPVLLREAAEIEDKQVMEAITNTWSVVSDDAPYNIMLTKLVHNAAELSHIRYLNIYIRPAVDARELPPPRHIIPLASMSGQPRGIDARRNKTHIRRLFETLEDISISYRDGAATHIGAWLLADGLFWPLRMMESGRVEFRMHCGVNRQMLIKSNGRDPSVVEQYKNQVSDAVGCEPELVEGDMKTDRWVAYHWNAEKRSRKS